MILAALPAALMPILAYIGALIAGSVIVNQGTSLYSSRKKRQYEREMMPKRLEAQQKMSDKESESARLLFQMLMSDRERESGREDRLMDKQMRYGREQQILQSLLNSNQNTPSTMETYAGIVGAQ